MKTLLPVIIQTVYTLLCLSFFLQFQFYATLLAPQFLKNVMQATFQKKMIFIALILSSLFYDRAPSKCDLIVTICLPYSVKA